MAGVEFKDNSVSVKSALTQGVLAFLEESGGEIEALAHRNQTRVKSGDTKGEWTHIVDEGEQIVTIGNPLENSIWEEFGTGEYALNGDGRKGGWKYKDDEGKWHATNGKKPLRALFKAYTSSKSKIIKRAEDTIGAFLK